MNESHAVTVTPGTPAVPPVTVTPAVVTPPSTVTAGTAGHRDSHGVTVDVPGHVTPVVPQSTVTVPLPLSRLSRRDSPGRDDVPHRDSGTCPGCDTGTVSHLASGTRAGHEPAMHVLIGTRLDGSPVVAVVPVGRDRFIDTQIGTGKSRLIDLMVNAERSSQAGEVGGGV